MNVLAVGEAALRVVVIRLADLDRGDGGFGQLAQVARRERPERACLDDDFEGHGLEHRADRSGALCLAVERTGNAECQSRWQSLNLAPEGGWNQPAGAV